MQLNNPFTIGEETMSGKDVSRQWQPGSYKDPKNYTSKMIKTSDFQMKISGKAFLEVEIQPGEEVRLITQVVDKVNTVNAIDDKSVVESSRQWKSF